MGRTEGEDRGVAGCLGYSAGAFLTFRSFISVLIVLFWRGAVARDLFEERG